MTSGHDQYLNLNTRAAGLVWTCAHGQDVWLLLSVQPSPGASARRTPGGGGWTSRQPPHRPKLGHYLFTDSSRLIWKRCTKLMSSICVWPALFSAVSLNDCGSGIKLCQLPVSCTCSVEGQAMIWRSSPLYSSTSRACSLRKTCWMLLCGRGGGGNKNPHLVTECRRKINTKFPSGLCPLTILFPCQQQQFCFSHSAFTWHLDEQYTACTKIPLLQFNHRCRGKKVQSVSQRAGPGAELDHSDVICRFNPRAASITH